MGYSNIFRTNQFYLDICNFFIFTKRGVNIKVLEFSFSDTKEKKDEVGVIADWTPSTYSEVLNTLFDRF